MSKQVGLFVIICFTAAACQRAAQAPRVIPGAVLGVAAALSEMSESALAATVVCHDTLGRPDGPVRKAVVTRCTPCVPLGMQAGDDRALAHARRLWLQGARAPYDTLDIGASCARLAYQYARARYPDNDSLAVEIALFQLFDARDSVRRVALRGLDSLLDVRVATTRSSAAAAILSQLGSGMWDRAQRQLERPRDLADHRLEQRVHDLVEGAPPLTRLPPLPATSGELGVSEAEWAARLFTAAALESRAASARSRLLRLALAPWIALNDWPALDSAARALLRISAGDSAVLPAIALAAHKRMTHLVSQSPRVMALFDAAMSAMPRVDSARYDSFDGVLAQRDDEWRYGFLPSDREQLDTRGWAVLDPLWSTPVNEIRLERRARTAEADYRYADIARPSEAGSETRAGAMLLRLGAPGGTWDIADQPFEGRRWLRRGWRTLDAMTEIDDDPDTWRVFYGPAFSIQRATMFVGTRGGPCASSAITRTTLYDCAISRPAEWRGLPFHGNTEAIDVSLARFRTQGDSAQVYIGARMPLRSFKSRDDTDARDSDRIVMSAWLTTSAGQVVYHAESADALPAPNTIAWFKQWIGKVGPSASMHRVEGVETSRATGARGAAQFTSDAQVAFPLKGYGMSDVLIAASAAPKTTVARRWTDLNVEPNGGVVAPAQGFAMVWEVYDLTPGVDGRVRWRVRIKRERGQVVSSADMQSVLVGSSAAGTKVLANESDVPDVSFTRDAIAAPVVLDYLNFSLREAAVGRHVVQVTVDDLVSGKSVSRSVSVRVLDADSQRRGTRRR